MPEDIVHGQSEMVTVEAPEHEDAAPVVFDSPHSGRFYPEDFGHVVSVERLRGYEDRFVDTLFTGAAEQGVSLVKAEFSRAYIDPNRALEDIDRDMLSGDWHDDLSPTANSALGIGLIFSVLNDRASIYDRLLTPEEVKARIDRCWLPYHDALGTAIEEARERAGAVWHLNLHSMRPVGDELSPDPGRERADFVLGDLDGTSCEAGFTGMVAETLEELGHSVAVNDPYKGAFIVARHGHPERRRHSLQIEINRALYLDLETLDKGEGFEALRADMQTLAGRIAGYARDRARDA